MKILIADDHILFRDGLKKIISEQIPDCVFGEAGSYGELLDKVYKSKWDLILLDLNMPGRSGFEALIELKSNKPKIKILVLSMYPENQFAARAIKAGAMGYLTKGSSVEELVEAIKSVLRGEIYFTKEVAKVIAENLRTSEKSKIEKLSDREYQVFLMLAEGERVSDIARKFNLSMKTVSTYKKRIFDKLEIKTDADLIKFAVENKLTSSKPKYKK